MKGRSKTYIVLLTLVATLGGLLFGYDTAVISGAVKHLEAFFITPLLSDKHLALAVLFQYKVTVGLVLIIIAFSATMIFRKLFGRTKGIYYSLVIFIILIAFLAYFFSRPMNIEETTISSIKGFTVSSALVGCIIGGSLGGFVSRILGRRKGLFLAAALFTLSAIGSAIPEALNLYEVEDIISFIIYRIIGGVGVGLASMLSPMYIAEIAPSGIRGKLVSWNQFAIILGMVIIYFVNYFIARGRAEVWINQTGWRWMFASETIPALLFIVFLFFVPETPRFLVLKEKSKKALGILEKINGKEEASGMLTEIKESLVSKSSPWLSYGGLVIVIGILLAVFQQLVGINVVLYYAPEIFRTLGQDTDSALFQTIIIGAINMIFTLVAIVTVDRFGRKPLQIIGAVGMAVSMIGLGFVFYFQSVGFGALIFMLLYTAAFAVSWGPVTWVLLSEIFPNSIRGAMSIAVAVMWVSNLLISWTFPMMNDNSALTALFHHGFAYWIYGIMAILAAFFVWKMVPETKSRSLESIEKIWGK